MAEKTQRMRQTLHTPVISKGRLGELQLTIWDVCDDCNHEECPIYTKCPYQKEEGMKCTVQSRYLDKVLDSILDRYKDSLDTPTMTRFGFEIIPLYSQLIKFKIAEMGVRSPVYYNDKGNPCVNPIYREIRAIVSSIGQAYTQVSGAKKRGHDGELNSLTGDESYVQSLLAPTSSGDDEDAPMMEVLPPEKKKKKRKKKKNADT